MAARAIMPQDDLDRIMAVMGIAFAADYNEAWTRAQLSGALLVGNCHYHLISANGTSPDQGEDVAGFALLRTAGDEEELLLFAVDPGFRRRGLGAKLLEGVKADAKVRGIRRILLEMRQGNSAERLYCAHNFTRIGNRPNYYRNHNGAAVDALTFSCTLD